MWADGWRLAVGTLTALPVRPPRLVDRRRAALAMLLAPLAVVPLGLAVGVLAVVGDSLDLSPLVVALLAVGAVALGNRGLHLDGLSDVADGLAASYDRERSLAVMKTGASGPAGTVAVVLVVGLQVAGLAGVLAEGWRGGVLAGVAVCGSRAALALCCLRGLRPARPDGLGRTYAETVSPPLAAGLWVVAAAVLALTTGWAGLAWWRGPLAVAVAVAVVAVLLARAVRRFGGVTGDVFGAAVESALAALLVALS
ncbi:cobalamin-5'-phosphate synthase [Nocardioides terrae]|uniref:Adenosylcobinamide-GDP ribazoletransferase n=1 Tax=Nocardioides terrae TaxID=574651 RepID=A0A1I1L0R6_9ACTN|nr:adenosylcobinamide-GDP ribazoletransferase [Nocardioides terrae]SFC66112.1 cobalamin-5'-phosphate synthase [Nocardioides terrae]